MPISDANIDVLDSDLFNTGFKNDETPLDDTHLNQILTAIKSLNKLCVEQLSAHNEMMEAETSRREALDKYITGIEDINDKNEDGSYSYNVDGEYENSNEKLRNELTTIQGSSDSPAEEKSINGLSKNISELSATVSEHTEGINQIEGDISGIHTDISGIVYRITGISDMELEEDYDNTNTKLRYSIDSMLITLDEITSVNVIEVDGKGIPDKNVTNWNGEYTDDYWEE